MRFSEVNHLRAAGLQINLDHSSLACMESRTLIVSVFGWAACRSLFLPGRGDSMPGLLVFQLGPPHSLYADVYAIYSAD